MSGTGAHWEKKQDIAGHPKTDTSGVSASANVTTSTSSGKDHPKTDIPGGSSSVTSTDVGTSLDTGKKDKETETQPQPQTQTKSTDENVKDKTKDVISDTYNKGKEKIDENTNMTSLLRHAQYCLEDFMNPNLNIEKQIPVRILSDALGLVFLTEYKGSLGVGTSIGAGLIIARKSNHQGWTGPCAVGMGGMSIGFQVGVQKTENIIVLRDENALKSFTSKGQLKLGGDISFAAGPLGRDASVAVNVNDKGYSGIYSYSMAKGAHIGTSLEGQVIMISDNINEDYYGKKVSADDILFDKIDSLPTDRAYASLTKLLEEYTQKKGQLSQEMFTSEENRKFDYQSGQKEKSDTTKKDKVGGNQDEGTSQKHDKSKDKKKHISVDRLLGHARFNLEHFMNPKLNIDRQIPAKLLKNCYGYLFLTEFKEKTAGVGPSSGAGFIIAHKSNGDEYSQPCAVSMGDIPVKSQTTGVKKTEHVFIFCDEQILNSFVNKGELNFGTDFSLAAGPLGRDVDVPLNANDKGYSPVFSYSISNGAYVGVTMENQKLNIRDDWNEEYFGKRVNAKDILFGKTKPESMPENKSYQALINLLKEYKKNLGKLEESHWNDQDRKEHEDWHPNEKDVRKEDEGWHSHKDVSFGKTEPLKDETNKDKGKDETHKDESKGKDKTHKDINKGKDETHKDDINKGKDETHKDINKGKDDTHKDINKGKDKDEISKGKDETNKDEISKGKEKDETKEKGEDDNGSMGRLLWYARCGFEDFVNPNLGMEKQIPIKLLSGAHAIVFLTELKAGFVVGASLGRGVILARRQDKGGWTGPCAIGLGGVSVGWLAGAEKTEHIIVLRDEKVLETFLSKGQLKFGGDMSFSIGPLGRDANVAVNVNDRGYAPIYSYSMSKGVYMGASLEGHLITIRNDTNEEYYGKKVQASDILQGHIEAIDDKEYKSLCESLDKYINAQTQSHDESREKSSDKNVTTDAQKDQDKDKFSSQNVKDQDKDKLSSQGTNQQDKDKDKFSSQNVNEQSKDTDKFSSQNVNDQNKDKDKFSSQNVDQNKDKDKFSSKNVDDQNKDKDKFSSQSVSTNLDTDTNKFTSQNVGDQNKDKDKFPSQSVGDQKDKDKFSSQNVGDQNKDKDKFSSQNVGDQNKDKDKFSSQNVDDQNKDRYESTSSQNVTTNPSTYNDEFPSLNLRDQNKDKDKFSSQNVDDINEKDKYSSKYMNEKNKDKDKDHSSSKNVDDQNKEQDRIHSKFTEENKDKLHSRNDDKEKSHAKNDDKNSKNKQNL